MELITGPFSGYWLACYTIETAAGHYAYAKLCLVEPQDVWETDFVTRKVCGGPYTDPAEGLRQLIEVTARRLERRATQASGWHLISGPKPPPVA